MDAEEPTLPLSLVASVLKMLGIPDAGASLRLRKLRLRGCPEVAEFLTFAEPEYSDIP